MMLNEVEKCSVFVRNLQIENMLRPGTKVLVESLDVLVQESGQVGPTSAMER